MDIKTKLAELGYKLPLAPAPAANYVPYVMSGNQLFVSGQIPFIDGKPAHQGRAGDDYSVQQAQEAAQICALNILAQVNAAVDGDWLRVKKCVKLGGFVSCTADFTDQPLVINAASDLIVNVMGEAGKHARFAVGAANLPLGVVVEIDAIFEIAG
jgi:enamine deaminase RidA (YjgF/YER057c/UK114 family)